MHQEKAYPWRVSGTALTNPDFCRYIEAFGGHGEVVTATGEFSAAFRRAVESGKPALIELRTNPEQITTRATISDLRAGKPRPKAPPERRRAAAPGHRAAAPAKARG
jgi:acetolactate synthase I/II/III large subunit